MKKRVLFVAVISIILASCSSTINQEEAQNDVDQVGGDSYFSSNNETPTKEEMRQFAIEAAGEEELWRYEFLEGGVSIENVLIRGAEVQSTDIANRAYSGYYLLEEFNLLANKTVKERAQLVNALLSGMPTNDYEHSNIRNIIVANWNNSGLTFAYAVHKTILEGGHTAFVLVPQIGEQASEEFMSIYLMLPDGRLGSTTTILEEITIPFESIVDTTERINLTHDYLTDNTTENDILVLPVLTKVIEDESEAAVNKLFARMQLFMYYLYSHDFIEAQETILDAQSFYDTNKDNQDLENFSKIILEDMPAILDIALELQN